VVDALAEIDSSLKNFHSSRKEREVLEVGVQANKRAVEIARARYEAGVENFLSVLEVEKTALELERQFVRAKTREAVSVALLHRALGSPV
jgi:multidrug efflux system outer membrane protein